MHDNVSCLAMNATKLKHLCILDFADVFIFMAQQGRHDLIRDFVDQLEP